MRRTKRRNRRGGQTGRDLSPNWLLLRFDQQCHAKLCTQIPHVPTSQGARSESINWLEGYLGGTAPLAHGKRKIECGASTRLGFRPDAATVAVDNAAHCR